MTALLQGASLAADRGKLEVEIARLREECEASKAALRTSEDAVKIKVRWRSIELSESFQRSTITIRRPLTFLRQNKVIDDQAHTMRVLRQTVADKEREVAGAQEEMRCVKNFFSSAMIEESLPVPFRVPDTQILNACRRREANLSDRLEAERQLSQQLQDELQQAQERKSRLKSELSDSQAELEALRREHAKLKCADLVAAFLGRYCCLHFLLTLCPRISSVLSVYSSGRTSWQDTAVKLTQLEQAVSGMHQVSFRVAAWTFAFCLRV